MSYFSRLTDIVTCNLQDLLNREPEPLAALPGIIREMEDGVAGAKRSVSTASHNEQRLRAETDEHRTQVAYWAGRAREELAAGREDQARQALLRKRELEDLIAALQQQQAAAASTREQLATTLRALEVRLADARRKLEELRQAAGALHQTAGAAVDDTASDPAGASRKPLSDTLPLDQRRAAEIEAELAALRKELEPPG